MTTLGIGGYLVFSNQGFENFRSEMSIFGYKLQDGETGDSHFYKYLENHFYPCAPIEIYQSSYKYKNTIRCFQSYADKPPSLIIIGDSHAEHLFIGLAEARKETNVAYYTRQGIPTIETPDYREIYQYIQNSKDVKIVLISAYWLSYSNRLTNQKDYAVILKSTIDKLVNSGKLVYLVADIPQSGKDPSKCGLNQMFRSWSIDNCRTEQKYYTSQNIDSNYIESFYKLQNPSLTIINPREMLCDESYCYIHRRDALLYRDLHHLNVVGSKLIGGEINKLIY